MLNEYAYRAIEKIKNRNTELVEKMFTVYPYEQHCEKNFYWLCGRYKISKNKYAYQECYDACQLAYMYSIYRCSVSANNVCEGYVKAYIKKVMKIYFVAALVICDDARNICRENGFLRIEGDDYRV